MQIQRVYGDWEDIKQATGTPSSRKRAVWREVLQHRPAIAYWGDSWFSTPLYKNLYWQSFSRIDGISLRLGGPGKTAEALLTPASCKDQAERLKSREFDLLCLSIGGNDCLGKRLEKIFERQPRMSAQDAFDRMANVGVFDRIRDRYDVALAQLSRVGPAFRVVGHGYAPVQRIGDKGKTDIKNLGLAAPLVGNVGPWLWSTMKHVLASKAEALHFARLMLGRGFTDMVLAPNAEKFEGLFSYADFSRAPGVSQESFWYDEIHPTQEGFAQLAVPFNAKIKAALPGAKRAAVG